MRHRMIWFFAAGLVVAAALAHTGCATRGATDGNPSASPATSSSPGDADRSQRIEAP
jgi:hypothetical protein